MALTRARRSQVPCAQSHTASQGLARHGAATDLLVASKLNCWSQHFPFKSRLAPGRVPLPSLCPPACPMPGNATTFCGSSPNCSCLGQQELTHLNRWHLPKFDGSDTVNRSHILGAHLDSPLSKCESQKGPFRSRPIRFGRPQAAAADDGRAGSTDGESVASTSGRAELSAGALGGDGAVLRDTRELVEVAMLAATTGLAYVLSTLLRLEVGAMPPLGSCNPLEPTTSRSSPVAAPPLQCRDSMPDDGGATGCPALKISLCLLSAQFVKVHPLDRLTVAPPPSRRATLRPSSLCLWWWQPFVAMCAQP